MTTSTAIASSAASAIGPTTTVDPTSSTARTGTAQSVLDQLSAKSAKPVALPDQTKVSLDSFLNLLVAQLKNQDPMQPVQNTEFITQLAQFQSLSSQLDMGKSVQNLVQLQQSQLALAGLSQAALLVGKNVTWTDKDGKSGAGNVQSVTVENGTMMINTEHGKVPVGALTSLALGQAPAPSAPGAGTGPKDGDPVATTAPTAVTLTNAVTPLVPPAQFHPGV
jgi:flagellar basal-body rod modification protein FlgD